MNVYVQTGQVSATLGCPGPVQKTVVVTAPWSGGATIDSTGFCWIRVTALVDGTTAVATHTPGRTVD
jgi:hypothetical protein